MRSLALLALARWLALPACCCPKARSCPEVAAQAVRAAFRLLSRSFSGSFQAAFGAFQAAFRQLSGSCRCLSAVSS
eukprot:2254916-Alexandrium_andersonii.AAC.1